MALQLYVCGLSDLGKKRQNNEDNLFINGKFREDVNEIHTEIFDEIITDSGVIAVLDGMGGEDRGEEASFIAAKTFSNYMEEDFETQLPNYLDEANKRIFARAKKTKTQMGSTVAGISINGNSAMAFNLGDSRVYSFEYDKLTQISHDHNRAAQLLEAGFIDKEEFEEHPGKNQLIRYLGMDPSIGNPKPDTTYNIFLHPGLTFLICSDGLNAMLGDEEIEAILSSSVSLREKTDLLVEKALERGAKDNVTVVLAECQQRFTLSKKSITTIVSLSIIAIIAIIIALLCALKGISLGSEKKNESNSQVVTTETTEKKDENKTEEKKTEENATEKNTEAPITASSTDAR